MLLLALYRYLLAPGAPSGSDPRSVEMLAPALSCAKDVTETAGVTELRSLPRATVRTGRPATSSRALVEEGWGRPAVSEPVVKHY